MTTCHRYFPFWLIVNLVFICDMTLISVIFSVYHFTSRLNPCSFSFMCFIFAVIYYSVKMTVSIITHFYEKIKTCCFLDF